MTQSTTATLKPPTTERRIRSSKYFRMESLFQHRCPRCFEWLKRWEGGVQCKNEKCHWEADEYQLGDLLNKNPDRPLYLAALREMRVKL
jgi:hypothetical protein